MSSKKTVVAFADTVLQHYPPFRWDEGKEAAWAATMVQELSGFSDEVVERAGRELVRTRRKPQTPLVSECVDACVAARRWVEAEKNSGRLPIEGGALGHGHLDWTADRLKLASELMSTPVGKHAAQEGWAGALWSFARKNARLPQAGAETSGCKDAARGFDEAYAVCVQNSSNNPLMRKLEVLGAEMLRRRHAIERRVLGVRP